MSTNNYDNRSYADTEDTHTKNGSDNINGSNGKGRAMMPGTQANGQPLVIVEPPRKEDLQPSYARVISGDDDAGAHGWYGGMSMSKRKPYHRF